MAKQIKVTKGKAAQYKAAVARMDQLYPSWAGAQRDLVKYSQHLFDKLRNAGIVTDGLYAYLTQKYPNYVPLQRDFGTEAGVTSFIGTKGLVNLASPIKRLKGSERDVLDPLLQIIANTYVVESLVGKQATEMIREGKATDRLTAEMRNPLRALWRTLGAASVLLELGTRAGQYQKVR